MTINIGTVADKIIAESTIRALEGYGFDPREISFAMKIENDENNEFGPDNLLINTARVGAITIPGWGNLILGGPMANSLGANSVAGLVVGNLAGTLIGLGVPESMVVAYEEDINNGRVILAVPHCLRNGEQNSKDILEQLGADKIESIEIEDGQRLI